MIKIPYAISNAVDPGEMIVRVVFSYFMNLGTFDDRMRALVDLKPESRRADHVGMAVFNAIGPDLKSEFLAWVEKDAFAQFALDNDQVSQSLDEWLDGKKYGKRTYATRTYATPIDVILGARFKAATGDENSGGGSWHLHQDQPWMSWFLTSPSGNDYDLGKDYMSARAAAEARMAETARIRVENQLLREQLKVCAEVTDS